MNASPPRSPAYSIPAKTHRRIQRIPAPAFPFRHSPAARGRFQNSALRPRRYNALFRHNPDSSYTARPRVRSPAPSAPEPFPASPLSRAGRRFRTGSRSRLCRPRPLRRDLFPAARDTIHNPSRRRARVSASGRSAHRSPQRSRGSVCPFRCGRPSRNPPAEAGAAYAENCCCPAYRAGADRRRGEFQ